MQEWLQRFEEDIISLQQLVQKIFWPEEKGLKKMGEEFREALAPLTNGTVDPGDLERVTEGIWKKFKSECIGWAKAEAEIQKRLATLYESLATASEEDWEAYAKMRLRAAITAQPSIWGLLAEGFVSQVQEPQEVTVQPGALRLKVGDKHSLIAEARDRSGRIISGQSFHWKPLNPRIADVDQKGVVTGVRAGKTMIIATETVTNISAGSIVTVL